MSRSPEGRDMPKSLTFVVIAAASLLPVAWLSLPAELDFEEADATSTAEQSKIVIPEHFEMAHHANQTTTRILALDQAKRLAFWTLVLKSRKETCDVVVRASYTGGAEAGLDHWSVACRNGDEYSINVEPDAENSVCIGDAFERSSR